MSSASGITPPRAAYSIVKKILRTWNISDGLRVIPQGTLNSPENGSAVEKDGE
jgi:hypothetical protein